MTAPAAPPDTEAVWITNEAIAEATGIHFTTVSRLRSQSLRNISPANMQALATGLSWPIGQQAEAYAQGVFDRELVKAAVRVGIPHAVGTRGMPGCQCGACPAITAES